MFYHSAIITIHHLQGIKHSLIKSQKNTRGTQTYKQTKNSGWQIRTSQVTKASLQTQVKSVHWQSQQSTIGTLVNKVTKKHYNKSQQTKLIS